MLFIGLSVQHVTTKRPSPRQKMLITEAVDEKLFLNLIYGLGLHLCLH